jgi:hypothetical protein
LLPSSSRSDIPTCHTPGDERFDRALPGDITRSECHRRLEGYAGRKVVVMERNASEIESLVQIEDECVG